MIVMVLDGLLSGGEAMLALDTSISSKSSALLAAAGLVWWIGSIVRSLVRTLRLLDVLELESGGLSEPP